MKGNDFKTSIGNYAIGMRTLIEKAMYGNPNYEHMRKYNEVASDILAYRCAHYSVDHGVKDQYMDDITTMYNDFEKIIDALEELKGVMKEYE